MSRLSAAALTSCVRTGTPRTSLGSKPAPLGRVRGRSGTRPVWVNGREEGCPGPPRGRTLWVGMGGCSGRKLRTARAEEASGSRSAV